MWPFKWKLLSSTLYSLLSSNFPGSRREDITNLTLTCTSPHPPPPPLQSLLHFNVGISQSPVIFNRDTGKEIMRGVDQTNTCLLTMIVVLLQNTFCLGSSSLQGSYLNLSKELKTCEKTYARIQHTPRLNVLHSLLKFHRIWFMKSRNEIPARENGLTGTTILLSLVTCAPFLMAAGLASCAPFVTTTGLVACAPFVTETGLLGR